MSTSVASPAVAADAEITPPAAARWKDTLAAVYEVAGASGRLRPMEGARGLAVVMVFFVHLHALFGHHLSTTPWLFGISQFLGMVGNVGVDLFFVISGYLIYGALVRREPDIRRFLWRRVERLYPVFLAVFALYLVLSVLYPQASKLHGSWLTISGYLAQNLLLLPGVFEIRPLITVSWSLSYEAFFYLSVSLLVWAMRMWRWPAKWRAGFAVAAAAGYWLCSAAFSVPHVRMLLFVAGILLYEASASGLLGRLPCGPGEWIAVGLFGASLVCVYLLEVRQSWFTFLPGWWSGRETIPGVPVYQGPYKTLALMVGCYALAAYAFAFDGRVKRLLCWAPMRYLGNMSYSYYLSHGIALQGVALACAALTPPGTRSVAIWATALVGGFAATWAASTALFVLVEKPMSLEQHARARHAKRESAPERGLAAR